MKKLCLVGAVAMLLLFLPLPVQAEAGQEAAQYSFASAVGSKEIRVAPGGESRGDMYFYNIDGNRITHITLEVAKAPSDWEVTIVPALSETQALVNDQLVTVEENLYVEPTDLLSAEPADVPAGTVSVKVPGRGYALGKLAQVVVRVPESAPLGSTGEVTIAGEAFWLGQSGAAAVNQARDFNFSITVASESSEYSETIIEEDGISEAAESTFQRWLPVIISGAIALLAVALIPVLVRRRR